MWTSSTAQRPEGLVSKDLAAQENLLARLDRMPVNGKILFLVGLLGVIWILEAFDIGIIAPVLFILKGEWQLSPSNMGLIGSAGTLGIVIGLLSAGRLADRFGRKSTLVAGIVIFSIVTFLAAFSQTSPSSRSSFHCRPGTRRGVSSSLFAAFRIRQQAMAWHCRRPCQFFARFPYGLNTLPARWWSVISRRAKRGGCC